MAPALVFVIFLLFFVAMIVWASRHAKKAEENFQRLAINRLGLTPVPRQKRFGIVWSQAQATGEIRGRPARLFSYTTGSGKSRVSWTALSFQPRDHGGLTFQLTQQGLRTKIQTVFGAKEITTGEAAFDAAWFIQTNQAAFLQAALIPELRARITASLANSGPVRRPSFQLTAGTLVYSEIGDFASEQRCTRIGEIAEVLSDFVALVEVFAQQAPTSR